MTSASTIHLIVRLALLLILAAGGSLGLVHLRLASERVASDIDILEKEAREVSRRLEISQLDLADANRRSAMLDRAAGFGLDLQPAAATQIVHLYDDEIRTETLNTPILASLPVRNE